MKNLYEKNFRPLESESKDDGENCPSSWSSELIVWKWLYCLIYRLSAIPIKHQGQGLERWLSAVLIQKTQVLFPAATWQFSPIYNPSSKGSSGFSGLQIGGHILNRSACR